MSDPCLRDVWTSTTLCGKCPHCSKVNYVSLGDLGDQTAPDVEVIQCWYCLKKSWISSDAREMSEDDLDSAFCAQGDLEK